MGQLLVNDNTSQNALLCVKVILSFREDILIPADAMLHDLPLMNSDSVSCQCTVGGSITAIIESLISQAVIVSLSCPYVYMITQAGGLVDLISRADVH